jgi:phospholipase A-2-activating protein
MDSVVKCWKVNEDGSYVESLNIYDHEHWITALITIPTSVVNTTTTTTSSSTNISGFITGCMDKKIRMYSEDGILVSILTGHEGGIISFGFTSDGHLISGSWDGTARIWDLKKALCIGVLSGHENGVCVLGLPNGTIVTGSTGKQVGNTVVDFQLRFWNQDFSLQKTLKDHTGPIRELSIVPEIGFCSCSNDGSIKIRTFDGQVVATMAHPLNAEGKPGFVLGVCTIVRQSMDSLIVSASEDCTARVWNLQGDLLQTIEHPSGLWGVTCLPNGDFITCCEDKVARVFTASIERQGSPQVIANFTAAIEEAKIVRQRGPKDVDIDQLPEYERRFEILGKTDGQIQMFKTNNNKAWACQWSQPSKTWIDVRGYNSSKFQIHSN